MTTAVLLMAHGTPDSLDEMEPYLRRVMHRPPNPAIVAEMTRRYARIGGRSPLTDVTRRQADALERRLGMPVHVGMLHWKPTISDAVEQARADLIVGICAAPHFAPITTNAYREALRTVAPSARFVECWHRQPALHRLWAGRIGNAERVLFTAHSIPVEAAEPYPTQLRETIAGIAPAGEWTLAYQSRSPSPLPWLEPDVESVTDDLHAQGITSVRVAPIGFVSDNAEILYDLDVVAAEHALRLGIAWSRAPMPNDDPLLIEAMANALTAALA